MQNRANARFAARIDQFELAALDEWRTERTSIEFDERKLASPQRLPANQSGPIAAPSIADRRPPAHLVYQRQLLDDVDR